MYAFETFNMKKEAILNSRTLVQILESEINGYVLRRKTYEYSVFNTATKRGFLDNKGKGLYKVTDRGREFLKVYKELKSDLDRRKAEQEEKRKKEREVYERRAAFGDWADYETPSKERRIRSSFIPYR